MVSPPVRLLKYAVSSALALPPEGAVIARTMSFGCARLRIGLKKSRYCCSCTQEMSCSTIDDLSRDHIKVAANYHKCGARTWLAVVDMANTGQECIRQSFSSGK